MTSLFEHESTARRIPTPRKGKVMRTCLFAALVATSVAGCITVGPDYVRPGVDTPDAWRIDYPKTAEIANTKWWEQFGDPVLNELIETALQENRDVRIAAARIDQFIGALTATRSQALPQVGYSTDASRTRASREGQPPIPDSVDPHFELYQAALGASWQLDLFGRVRRLSEAAQARVYASEQAQRGVVLSLVSGVASSYIALRGFDQQREIVEATARNFGETERIFQLRFDYGVISNTELMQIKSQHRQALAAIPAIEQQITATENRISLLLGRNPGPIPRGKTIDELTAPPIPGDLPAALLQRRPDILQAEQNLVAANASIGAARALYYPTISLTGLLGSISTSFGNFLSGSAKAWSAGASLAGPIFTSGAVEGQVRAAEAQERQAFFGYEQTILNAFRETNDALSGSQNRIEEVAQQRERVVALREFARLSRLKFEAGLVGYVEVLVADNELFAAEIGLARVLTDRHIQAVNVYQAMGGGWVDTANALTQQPAEDL
ncbi:efflux transporter outer membrane subunit [Luteimonas sp. A534]